MAHVLKNLSGFPLDIPTVSGPMVLPAYGEITADLSAIEAEMMVHSPYVEIAEAGKAPAKKAETAGAYEARETSRGWFKVHDAGGKIVGKAMREDDAKAFNALSDADKAAAVAEMEA